MLLTERAYLHHRQRHRAHRVAVDPGHRHPQGLLPAGHRHWRRHRADRRGDQHRSLRITAPGNARRPTSSSSTPPTCRWRSSRASSKTLPEQKIFDYGLNFIRLRLFTIPGLATPAPYGGKQRQIMVDVDPRARWPPRACRTHRRGQPPCSQSNVILPAGDRAHRRPRIQHLQLNSSPATVEQFDQLPLRVVNGRPVLLGRRRARPRRRSPTRPTSSASTANAPRYLAILKHADASTLAVVEATREVLPPSRRPPPKAWS